MLNHSNEPGTDQAATEIMDLLIRILNKAAAIEREPIDIGHGILLHASEVHLIDMAGRFPGDSISRLASRLGITKGAVSQTVKKLEEKGYLVRVNEESNKKTVKLRLTDRGTEAFAWHRTYHALVNSTVTGEFSRWDRDDIEKLKQIFGRFEVMLDRSPSVRKEHTERFIKSLR